MSEVISGMAKREARERVAALEIEACEARERVVAALSEDGDTEIDQALAKFRATADAQFGAGKAR